MREKRNLEIDESVDAQKNEHVIENVQRIRIPPTYKKSGTKEKSVITSVTCLKKFDNDAPRHKAGTPRMLGITVVFERS